MDEYIEEALAAGFFFVEKKDSGLQPCIDYRGLNMIKVRYPCPLPLVLTALEQLQEARIFTKLDLRSAYNLETGVYPRRLGAQGEEHHGRGGNPGLRLRRAQSYSTDNLDFGLARKLRNPEETLEAHGEHANENQSLNPRYRSPCPILKAQALDYYTELKNVKFFDILKPFVMKCLFTIYGRSLQCQYTMRKKG
ncbi:hypothetical protein QTP70_011588 [Hemibagrus guttatus]|uniref:Reverse transcriptase n=1 Tax=Hemibagrus guttatus TaxID=175788 RepID=A0AAE0QQC2_9TELE|nr:hypothetical protein QTP70_011588 [Hemibagrus guttatus]